MLHFCHRTTNPFSLLAFSVLFAIALIFNVADENYHEATATFVLALVFGYAYIYFSRQQREAQKLTVWLLQNAGAIQAEQAVYERKRLKLQTEIVRFEACFSYVLLTIRLSSRYYVIGQDSTFLVMAVYSLLTFMFGWFGFPWGIINTIQVLKNNFKGGIKQTVSQVLAGDMKDLRV